MTLELRAAGISEPVQSPARGERPPKGVDAWGHVAIMRIGAAFVSERLILKAYTLADTCFANGTSRSRPVRCSGRRLATFRPLTVATVTTGARKAFFSRLVRRVQLIVFMPPVISHLACSVASRTYVERLRRFVFQGKSATNPLHLSGNRSICEKEKPYALLVEA